MPRRKEKTVIRNGIEYYYKSIRDERGKYITVYGRTIAERDEKVKKREAEIRLRRKIKEFPTFSERATEWLSDKSKDLKRNTYNNYEQIIRTHFIPVLGNKRLIDITGEDIKKAMATAETQSASVYRKASMLIKQIFADALTCDLIQIDPTTKHTFKRVRHEKEDTGKEYLTDAQVSVLLAAVNGIYPLETFVRLGLYAGLRKEESLALRWDCVDLNPAAPILCIRWTSTIYKNRAEIEDSTKSPAGARDIPIPPPLFNHLKELQKTAKSDFVICGKNGNPLSGTQFRNMWAKIKRRSVGDGKYTRYDERGKIVHDVKREAGQTAPHNPDVRYTIDFPIKTHMLRKTYITNLIYSGVDVRKVMGYAGHKNPDVTLKIYAQNKSAEKRAESAKQINEVFPSDPTT